MKRFTSTRPVRLVLAAAMVLAALAALSAPSNAATPSCVDGSLGCPWQTGDQETYSRDVWASGDSNVSTSIENWYFDETNFGANPFVLGAVTARSDSFTTWQNVQAYEAAAAKTGAYTPLAATLTNPTSDASGPLGPEVLALYMNVQGGENFDMPVRTYPFLADMTMCDLPAGLTALDGQDVKSVLPIMNLAMSDEPGRYSFSDLGTLAQDLNMSFDLGVPSSWAQQHLFSEGCQTASIEAFGPAHVQQTGTSATVSTTVTSDHEPLVNAAVLFNVNGVNTGNGVAYTDGNGVATFSYTGTNAGLDSVAVSTDFANPDLNQYTSTPVQWSASPGELRIHGPGSTLYAGSQAAVTATVAAGGTATFNAEVVNIGEHPAQFYLQDSFTTSPCGQFPCANPTVKMTAGTSGLTFLPLHQEWETTNSVAAGKLLAVTITVKMPSNLPPGVGLIQQITMLSTDGITLDGEYLVDAVTLATGTQPNDLFATVSGSSKTGTNNDGDIAAVAPAVLTVGKTTTATFLVKNDTGTTRSVTTTIAGANDCANDFSVTAKNGITAVNLYGGYPTTLAAKASVTITVTLTATSALVPNCSPESGLWYVTTSSAGASSQQIDLIGNEQAT
jgi:hypothetical protein